MSSLPPDLAALPDFDLDDDELRAAGTAKWGAAPAGVLPAWVAEMDVRGCPPVVEAVLAAVRAGRTGYADLSAANGLAEATTAFLLAEFGWQVDPAEVTATADVMAGIRLVLETCCEPGPVVVPVPTYPPFLAVAPLTGRDAVRVPLTATGGGVPALDLSAIGAALAAGARTVLLSSPHNPSGRAFTRAELEGLRDVVLARGARVISDEIHAPLVLAPGRSHVPFASLDGAGGCTVTVLAASKAWNVAGLKCAQIVTSNPADRARLRAVAHVANGGTSPLGVVATVAAYREGGAWLAALREQLSARLDQLMATAARDLPGVRVVRPEATYLAWLDASAYATGESWDAAASALRGGVMLSRGPDFAAPATHARLNVATSAERLERILARLAEAWAG
ncbi:MAG: aminotransferase class I/II-fold pyridoxal phosphate-dependent enzyme [Kineosporiaceae bacterium]